MTPGADHLSFSTNLFIILRRTMYASVIVDIGILFKKSWKYVFGKSGSD